MKKVFFFCFSLLVAAPSFAAQNQSNVTPPRALSSQTLQQIRAILANPKLQNGNVGIEIRAVGSAQSISQFPARNYNGNAQPVLFSHNATRRFLPASNVKLFTAALSLRALGENKTFATTVASTRAARNGVIDGDVRIIGGGDPSLQTSDIEKMAREIAGRGVRRIAGDVVGDGRAFGAETFGARYPDGWTLDDALWYYGPEVSALSVNRNQIDVTLTGAKTRGAAATVKIDPPAPTYFRILSRVTTAASTRESLPASPTASGSLGESGALRFDRADADSVLGVNLTIRGVLQNGQSATEGVAVPDAPRWAAQLLRDALWKNGVVTDGIARGTASEESKYPCPKNRDSDGLCEEKAARYRADALPATQLLARHHSAPLGVLLQRFLKNSDNLYGEMLLRDAALWGDATLQKGAPTTDFAARGHFMLRRFLAESAIASADLRFTDGSGLSRYNLLTPRATTQLLASAQKLRGGTTFWNALPIAGEDGTLRKRMASTRARGNVRAKTGTFSIASALSGYVTTQSGDRLAVAIFTNFCDGSAARQSQNELFSLLAQSRR